MYTQCSREHFVAQNLNRFASLMSDLLIASASDILVRANQLEIESKLTQSLVCYEEGIGILLKRLKSSSDPTLKLKLKDRINVYITRAEEIKNLIQQKKRDGRYHEHIVINENDTGYGYRKLFSRFLDDGTVTSVCIDDPFIRNSFQIEKFSHFCEVLVASASPVQQILLRTGVYTEKPQEQLAKFNILKQDLELNKVAFTWTFSPSLHDRQIVFNNGWVVKIGRGLDYIKKSPHKFVGLGVHDFDFRPCLETTVDIYFEGQTPF
uniref:MIT domain-containing protein n=1 Tax=Mesocestoides corti TaxID=53468 RepID=A0A5K3FL38_MESCO